MKFLRKLFGKKKKVFVLGIDGAPPQLIFDKWLDDLPNLKSLLTNSIYGRMQSSIPPSTIVAWTSFLTGKDPSFFDVYSYTYKDDHNEQRLSNSQSVKTKRLWEYLNDNNKRSILVNIPLTYPVTKLNGIMIGGFLTPESNENAFYPPSIKGKVEQMYGSDYLFDVGAGLAGYKNLDPETMLARAKKMTEQQLTLVKDFITSEKWDFCMTVLLGSDRIQHTMWKYHDPLHKEYPGENPYQNELKKYYQELDQEIATIKAMLDEDTYLIVASDHGFDRMDGRVCLNDWLIQGGYLVLKEPPHEQQKLDFQHVDWSQTRAYAIGAYFGRIYFNRTSRDPINGIVRDSDVPILQNEIIQKLSQLPDDTGNPLEVQPFKPQEIYKGPYRENGPDLYIYFNNLQWGVNNDVGNSSLYSLKTTKGSDDAGHSPTGIFVLHHPSIQSQEKNDLTLPDVLPTICTIMGIPIPEDVQGGSLL